ncbi:hypothetical protein [Streptomyces sp. NPDC058335]|uniref:hypothetical protein n=1 Tax=Streptomyces sp. NPDC058335 TaxID=3346451 RepID=UPI00366A384E
MPEDGGGGQVVVAEGREGLDEGLGEDLALLRACRVVTRSSVKAGITAQVVVLPRLRRRQSLQRLGQVSEVVEAVGELGHPPHAA